MNQTTVLGIILAALWGAMWAAFIQFNYHGRFLAARMTWLSVVIGIGIDLLILALVIPLDALIAVVAVIGASSLPIITRSLLNESMDSRKFFQMKHERNEPTHPKADSE
ncbi:MAG: hypothetical protein ACOYBO_00935 [Azonexus sp.]